MPLRTLLLLCQHVSPGEIKDMDHNVQKREMWVGNTLIQLDVAATKKLCWLCRLSTGSLNILNTLFCLFYFLKCVSSHYYGISPFGVFFYKADLKIQFCNLMRRNETKNGTNLPIIPSKNESPRHSTDRVYLYKKMWFINAFSHLSVY